MKVAVTLSFPTSDMISRVCAEVECFATNLNQLGGSVAMAKRCRDTIQKLVKAEVRESNRHFKLFEIRLMVKNLFPTKYWKIAESVWEQMDKLTSEGKFFHKLE